MDRLNWFAWTLIVGAMLTTIILVMMMGLPRYNVWQQGLAGEAALRRAEQERRIAVTQAQAEVDASKLRAQAIAEVGQAAKDFPEYRYQEFLGSFAEALREGNIEQIIYVPTEAMIPLTEASRAIPTGNEPTRPARDSIIRKLGGD